MGISNFELKQQAAERALAHVDELRAQGMGLSDSIDHACLRFGCLRSALMRLLNERDYGLLGTSGVTEYGCISTPMAGTP